MLMTKLQSRRSRGYFAIGVERPKNEDNIGTLLRSAVCFDAAFMFTVGRRFPRQASDTLRSWRHTPIMEYDNVADWHAHIPYDCVPVGVEISDRARPLETFVHPERAIYILGPEDGSLSREAQLACAHVVQIETRYCLNLAVAGSVLLYDRHAKRGPVAQRPERLVVSQVVAGSSPVGTALESAVGR